MHKYLIKTKHLGLRFIRKDDIDYLKDVDQDPEVKEFYPQGTMTDTEIKEYINKCISLYENKKLPCFVIFELESDEFVGKAYFGQLDTGEIKVGYLFHKDYWNKGYATETLKVLLEWAKTHIDAEYIIAYADKNNTASFQVMEKCGMSYYKEGYYLDMESWFYQIKNQ